MKRFVLLSLALAGTVGSGVALADDPPLVKRVQATWQVASLEDLRFLTLVYESGGCARGNASVDVDERATRTEPKPGDLDAPDLELRLYHPSLWAFVALYADPARARENAPAIRHNVRRFDGSLERHGRVSIVWVERPAAAVAAAIRRCVAP